ncbi:MULTISPECIES: HNH endonuclease [Amycolatopsis]|uniref:HNH endonuclease n=1 Tax=Amycolatopsis TaxID=1813 RepID=UPI003D70886A
MRTTSEKAAGYTEVLHDVVRALVRHDRATADARMGAISERLRPPVPRRTPPVRVLAEIFERDRYQCRYCGVPTVLTPVMRLLSTAYPEDFPYHRNWKAGEVHPAVATISATHDHIEPVTRGGDPLDRDNIVTACWVCNSAKGNLTLDVLGWTLRAPADDGWHGLADHYADLWEALGRPALRPGERAWLAAAERLYPQPS